MCDPVSIIAGAGAAIQIGSAVAGHAAQEERAEATREAARKSFAQRVGDLNLKAEEVRENTSRTIFQAERQVRAAMALERVSQGEAGISGVSAEAVRRDLESDAAEFKTASLRNERLKIRALERRKEGARRLRDARISGAQGGNPFMLGLRIAGAGVRVVGSAINSGPTADTDAPGSTGGSSHPNHP